MNKIIRYWNQNRKQIIIVIAIIAFIIIILNVVNGIFKMINDNSKGNTSQINIEERQKPTQSVITGQNVSKDITDENVDIIKEFVDYCNNMETSKAYELLSNDCKEEFNNDINIFIKNYCKRNFQTKKIYNLELMFKESNSYTYKTTYYEDNLLATGGSTSNNFEDYITIIKQNGENKLNINNFIKKQEINKTQTTEEIEIYIKSKRIYREYEQYRIEIKNNTENTISISNGENDEDICLLDKNNVKYVSFLYEIPIYSLSIKPKRTTELDITFNKIYDTYRIMEKMQFDNIRLNQSDNTKTTITIKI